MSSICHAQEQVPTPQPSINAATPLVWIFNGTPGDARHHDFYEENLASLRKSFSRRFAVPTENITVLYGPKSAGYEGPCTREALLAELAKIVAHTRSAGAAPVWILFQGHANAVSGGAMFNLPGPDLSMREIGDALKECSPQTPLIVLGTTTVSASLAKRVSGPGRYVITATAPGDKENETEYPRALAQALEAEDSDSNRDGVLSLTELFLATNRAVLSIYAEGNYIVKEHAQLDGNGDGRATLRPAQEDAEGADRIGLAIAGGKPKFE